MVDDEPRLASPEVLNDVEKTIDLRLFHETFVISNLSCPHPLPLISSTNDIHKTKYSQGVSLHSTR